MSVSFSVSGLRRESFSNSMTNRSLRTVILPLCDLEIVVVWVRQMRSLLSSHFSMVISVVFLLNVRVRTTLMSPCNSYNQKRISERSLEWSWETITSRTTAGHFLDRPRGGLLGAHPPSPCWVLLVPFIVFSEKPCMAHSSPAGSTAAESTSWKATRAAECTGPTILVRSKFSGAP